MREEVKVQTASLEENLRIASEKESTARAAKNQAESVISNLQARYNSLSAEAKAEAERAAQQQQQQQEQGGGQGGGGGEGGGGGGGGGGHTGSIVADRACGEIGKPYV